MKKLAYGLLFLGSMAASALALDLIDIPNEAGPAKVKEICITNNVMIEADVTDLQLTNVARLAMYTARTTTGVTNGLSYTPRYVGDVLVNTTSNMVWIATTASTNGWVMLSN